MRWIPLVLSTILVAAGCSSADPSLEGTPEPTDEASDALTGSIPIGTTLRATTALNLRSGPSTGHGVLRVIPSGASVKTVNTTSSTNGFYNVEYAGTVGWSYGGYLEHTTNGGGGGSGDAYYLTSFGGGNDTQGMACGGTADGTWWYAADSQRFGCGSKLLVRAGSKCVVVKVADYGPATWVEKDAGRPIVDATPLACKYFFGTSSCGWSDHRAIVVRKVDGSHATGPVTCF